MGNSWQSLVKKVGPFLLLKVAILQKCVQLLLPWYNGYTNGSFAGKTLMLECSLWTNFFMPFQDGSGEKGRDQHWLSRIVWLWLKRKIFYALRIESIAGYFASMLVFKTRSNLGRSCPWQMVFILDVSSGSHTHVSRHSSVLSSS